MNAFDIFLLVIIFLSCFTGLRTGFVKVVVHTAAIFVGLLAAFWCYGIVSGRLSPLIHQPLAADILSFCIIFIGVLIIGALAASLLATVFAGIGLGWLDHLLGGMAGLLRGSLLVAVLVAVLLAFTPLPTPAFIAESKVLPYATVISGALADMAPKQLRDGFVLQMQRLKQLWGKPPSKEQRIA
jgi:membrane protein required for colicin V production